MTLRIGAVAAVLFVTAALSSCGSSAKSTINEAGARTAAEAMRGELKAAQLKPGQTVRDVVLLQKAADRIPGSPQITGISDTNHDGKDDDGKVDIAVGKEHACLTAQDNGTVDVTNGAC